MRDSSRSRAHPAPPRPGGNSPRRVRGGPAAGLRPARPPATALPCRIIRGAWFALLNFYRTAKFAINSPAFCPQLLPKMCHSFSLVVPKNGVQHPGKAPVKFKSQILQQASGSVGGATYSRNKGGMYIRQRGLVKQTNTPQQQAIKNAVALLVNLWNSTVTQTQRDAWAVYAKNTPLLDKLGDSRQVTALNMFCRYNVPAMQSGSAPLLTAPTVFNLGSFTPVTITSVSASTGHINLHFNPTDAWHGVAGGKLLVYAGRPQNPGKTFFKGPYRFAGSVTSAVVTSAAVITAPFAVSAGARVHPR